MKNHIPKIRFKGAYNENGEWVEFTHPWEQRKVSELTSSYSGGTPKAGTEEYYDGDIPFIRSGEIYSDTTELFISEAGLNSSSAKMVHVGDILYALYGATSGEVSRARLDGAINQAILALIPTDKTNADFLVEWFRKEKFQITDKYLQGGQGNLSAQIIKDLEVPMPTLKEQNQIGEYFSMVNNLITLHQHKCELYQQAKQSMMEKLFTQSICFTSENGNEFPKWIEKTLQDLENENKITLNRGNIIPKSEGKYPVYSASTKNNGLMCYSDKYMFDEELITWSIDGGGDFFYRPKHKFSITNVSGYIKIIDQNYLIYKYLAYQLQYLHNFLRFDYLSKAHPSVIRELYTVHIPYLEEQIKIANILSKYDELIAISKNQLNTLQTLKKGLLQQMFV